MSILFPFLIDLRTVQNVHCLFFASLNTSYYRINRQIYNKQPTISRTKLKAK
nr:MAG TPA: hypothetical protein [Caudoviricetes sp.]